MRTQMLYVFPILTIFIAASLPAAFALYWFTATAFAALQHVLTFREKPEAAT
jgi:membrane protein insertase Oxa1/YidC/SpoIIIJ